MTTGMPGKRCGERTTRLSVWCSTASIFSRGRRTSAPSEPSRETASSWCRWPTLHSCRWIICPGAVISATFRGKAICRSSTSWKPWPQRALTVPCRWKSSTTSSAPAPPAALPSTAIGRCSSSSTSWRRNQPHSFTDSRPCRKDRGRWVEFVEFAVDETSAPKLEKMFASLGFRRAGQHKSKAVTRWHQGPSIWSSTPRRKVLPIPSTSLTARRFAPSASRSTTPRPHSNARSVYWMYPFGNMWPGELDIPAVRGVGGSLIYFLDSTSELGRVWEIEFEDTGERQLKCAGLTTVDHISQSMHYEEMLTWLLFYTSLLDLKKVPPQDVADPGGLVRSQVIEADDGSCASYSTPRRATARNPLAFLRRCSGPACSTSPCTDDIVDTVARLTRNGVRAPSHPGKLLRRSGS